MPHGDSPRHSRRPRKKKAAPRKAASPRSESAETRRPRSASGGGRSEESSEGFDPSVRLQKLLAGAGFGSRREVERFLEDERVTVNGRVAKLGDRADPGRDEIRVDGERLKQDRPTYWIVNKPRGVVTTVRDDEGRRTVVDLLPRKVARVFPVGRLDRETSGLLLLTNDGDVAHALLHPSLGNEREYKVSVKGRLDSKAIGRLERGVRLEEGMTSPGRVADVRFDPDTETTSLSLTLGEGRKRQIRRSLLVLGFPVRRLVRIRMGPLKIGRLAVGEARPLRSEERRALFDHVKNLRSGDATGKKPRGVARKKPKTAASKKKAKTSPPSGPRASGPARRADGSPPSGPAAGRGRSTSKTKGPDQRVRTGSPKKSASRKKKSRTRPVSKRKPAAGKSTSGPGRPTKSASRGQRAARSKKGTRK